MRLTRDFYKNTNTKYDLIYEDSKQGIELYYYVSNREGRLCILMFQGKGQKPYKHFAYLSAKERDEAKERYLGELQKKQKAKENLAAEKRAFRHSLEVGDILRSAWGYEQSNNDFYQVISRTDKSVVIREIGYSYNQTGWLCGDVTPIANSFKGEAMSKRVSMYGHVRINSYCSASKCDPTDSYYDSSYA